jgi:hypothetical protein
MADNGETKRAEQDRNRVCPPACILEFVLFLITGRGKVRESSMHQACIVNRKEHDDRRVVKMEISNTCRKEQEEIIEMKISHL